MLKKKVFISYAVEDKNIALRLYNDLSQEGVELWIDRENLIPGQNWEMEIKKAIKKSAYFLALVSTKSIDKKGFTQKELKYALDILDEEPFSDIYIVPVRIDDCRPIYGKLQDLHWVDLFPSYEEGLKKILMVLKPATLLKPDKPWERK